MSSLLRPPRARSQQPEPLDDKDLPELARMLDADPLANVVLAARLDRVGSLAPARLGGAVLGRRDADGRLAAAVFCGGSLLPVGGAAADLRAIGAVLATRRRSCSSIVGRADAVRPLWEVLQSSWGPVRLIRERQPLLLLDQPPTVPATRPQAPPLRVMTDADLDAYLPAAVAMFREELDLPPLAAAMADEYRRRVAALIRRGRAYGMVDDHGQVLFKADIGSVSRHTCQVQGVWTRPDQRGKGIATAALAAVLLHGLELAPSVSLYVNDFNDAARRLYARLGMREVGTLTTVLF